MFLVPLGVVGLTFLDSAYLGKHEESVLDMELAIGTFCYPKQQDNHDNDNQQIEPMA